MTKSELGAHVRRCVERWDGKDKESLIAAIQEGAAAYAAEVMPESVTVLGRRCAYSGGNGSIVVKVEVDESVENMVQLLAMEKQISLVSRQLELRPSESGEGQMDLVDDVAAELDNAGLLAK
jgi:hypothetical protein